MFVLARKWEATSESARGKASSEPPSGAENISTGRAWTSCTHLPRGRLALRIQRPPTPGGATTLEIIHGLLATDAVHELVGPSGGVAGAPRVGLVVASNSGRPGGAVYSHWETTVSMRLKRLHAGHNTQEECVVSSFLAGAVDASPNDMHARCTARTHAFEQAEAVLFSTLRRQFGMVIDDREE